MQSVSSAPQTHRHYNFLDGIRGWAALVVVVGHITTGVITTTIRPEYVSSIWLRFFLAGHFSVLVFFVLSGYVLSVSQLTAAKPNIALAFTARYFRLAIPILTVSLIAYVFLKFGLFYNSEAASTPEAKGWLGRFYTFAPHFRDVFQFSLYDTFFNYSEVYTYNSSLWTMPFEIAGSYIIYTYLALFRIQQRIVWPAALILYLFLLNYSPMLGCFIVGYAIAELKLWRSEIASRYAEPLGLIVLAATILIITFHNPARESLQGALAAIFVLAISYSRYLRAFYSCKLSRFLGKISFPLYLIQIVVICSWSSYLRIILPQLPLSSYQSATIILSSSLLLCFCGACLLTPVEKFSTHFSKTIAKKLLRLP